MSRRLPIALLAGATALSLVSCASIPGSGPVQLGLTDLNQVEQPWRASADGPTVGATQEELVRGFMQAAVSSADDYAVAREFLAREYAMQWDPYDGALIRQGSGSFELDGEEAGTLSLTVVATVDSTGRMLPLEPGDDTDLRFEFVNEDGEWRISSAPIGIILDTPTFDTAWESRQIYFFGPGGRLVPESRWFLGRSALATDVVTTLLAGPSERLSQSVYSAFPPGTKLANNVVNIEEGRAHVDLVGDGLDNAKTQREMLTQLTKSLTSLPASGVNRVELSVNGTPVTESPEPHSQTTDSSSASRLAVFSEGEFGIPSGQKVESIDGVSRDVELLAPNAVALSRSGTVAAARNADGVYIVSGNSVAVVDERSGLLEPSVDDDLWVWTYATSAPAVVRVAAVSGEQYELAAPWLAELDVRALRVAPGGSLVAAFVNEGAQSYVLVAGVIRDNDGVPVGLTAKADVELWVSGSALDFDWLDASHFVAITEQDKVTEGGPGLFSTPRGSVPDAVRIAGAGSAGQIRVLNTSGQVFSGRGSTTWQRVFSSMEVEMIAKRG